MQQRKKKVSLLSRASHVFKIPAMMALPPRVQYGALPWRMTDGTMEVMLVTSRGTGRWIIPKGWPHEGFSSAHSAAQEAYEEAGITGSVTGSPIGSYRYDKIRDEGEAVECAVHVHALEVAVQLEDWPEKQQRETAWFSRQEAAARVQEPELSELILSYAPPMPFS
jgi:8-oxo-dGTP pyrophosphatase MutT (NUDIX family)